jgi:hypothetical protein
LGRDVIVLIINSETVPLPEKLWLFPFPEEEYDKVKPEDHVKISLHFTLKFTINPTQTLLRAEQIFRPKTCY